MHELGITQAIVDTALRHAQQAGAQKIRALHVRVGALSGVVADSVQFYFEFASQDTLAQGARLQIEIDPPRVRCRACGAEQVLPSDNAPAGDWYARVQSLGECACGQKTYELAGGFDCVLESIDVE